MGRRSEGGVGNGDANLGTRTTRTSRQVGREGQATGDLPLPPPPALASGVIDGMLVGVLAWAILTLTLLPALRASAATLFPVLLLCLCAGGTVGLLSWTPEGMIGGLFKMRRYLQERLQVAREQGGEARGPSPTAGCSTCPAFRRS